MILAFYILFSIGLFAGICIRAYHEYDNFFDACKTLISDKLYANFTFNFFVAIGLLIVNLFLNNFIGSMKEIAMGQLYDKLRNYFTQLLFLCLVVRHHVGMKEFIFLPIPLFLRYIQLYISQRITLFSLSAIPPTAKQHQDIAAGQIITLFAFFYAMLQYIKKFQTLPNDFIFLLIIQLFQGLCYFFIDMAAHIIYLSDRHNNGNSQSSFRSNLVIQLIFEVIILISGVYFFIHVSSASVYALFAFKNVFDLSFKIIEKIKKFYHFQRLRKTLGEKLPDATAEDLQEESLCIICRNDMEPGKAKKLPCGHCFHIDCLERWVGQQIRCPTCQRDLTQVIKSMNSKEKEPNANANNNQEQQQQVPNVENQPVFNANNVNVNINIPKSNNEFDQIDLLINRVQSFENELQQIRTELIRIRNEQEPPK